MPIITPFSLIVLTAAAACAGVVGFTLSAGIRDDMMIAVTVSLAAAAGTIAMIVRRPGFAALVARPPALARTLFVIGCLAVGAQLAWLVPFIIDPTRSTWTPSPLGPMPPSHSCVSSYWIACAKVNEVPNVYEETLYSLPQTDPTAMRRPRRLGPLAVDNFEYPPTFLLIPRLLGFVTTDFWSFRRLWFALNFGLVVAVAVMIARRLDDRLGTHAVWLTPYVVAGPAIVATFQAGNVQMATIALTLLAMACIDRRRHALGGALLAIATAAKLYPGIFVLYLLLRRDWRPLIWTAAFGAALLLVSLVDVGWTPYRAFLHEMPGLMSGEAFSAFRNPGAIGNNGSVPGLVFKLRMWGVPGMGFDAMRIVGWIYTLVVIAGTAWMVRRLRRDAREPVIWLAVLVLATMRSPFMATYAAFPSLWLATVAVPIAWVEGRSALPIILCWCALALGFGPASIPPRLNAVWTTIQTVLTFAMLVLVIRRLRAPARVSEADGQLSRAAVAET